jgi:hypothetical protein
VISQPFLTGTGEEAALGFWLGLLEYKCWRARGN